MAGGYLKRWEPFKELVDLRTSFDRLFDRFFENWPEPMEEFWAPAIDVVETDGHIEVKAELPGLKKEDIRVKLEDNVLTISGERKKEKEEKDKRYYRVERCYGRFLRSIELPTEVEPEKVEAKYKDGVLSITIPKPESARPKEIEVKVE
ncbi:Hsp20/alpha crystallin family protein [candidate division WOR-3 bacterium]|uniref:Hsp20/alpha crystallin family protein n=1 Tax=candidate division WOR-3 bacterium TaxID=2052148 RepID=A0A660SHD5_UNCW3|nr:MAG: Hsp20/alpha crystallin family protein [candidate division WOR-3 bacterium]